MDRKLPQIELLVKKSNVWFNRKGKWVWLCSRASVKQSRGQEACTQGQQPIGGGEQSNQPIRGQSTGRHTDAHTSGETAAQTVQTMG